MSMGMNLDEKIKRVVAIIDEALTVQKTNPVYVPTLYFESEHLGFPSPRDVFRVLLENGAVKSHTKWWGYEMIEENGKRKFDKTSADEPQNDDDFEVYEITVDEKKLHPFRSAKRASSDEVEFDAQNGALFYGKRFHTFQKSKNGKIRTQLFRILWDRKKVIRSGKERPKGELFPASAVAVQLGFVNEPRLFEKNTDAKDKLDALLKNVEGTLQRKKIPIRLYQKGGIQIIVDLK